MCTTNTFAAITYNHSNVYENTLYKQCKITGFKNHPQYCLVALK